MEKKARYDEELHERVEKHFLQDDCVSGTDAIEKIFQFVKEVALESWKNGRGVTVNRRQSAHRHS